MGVHTRYLTSREGPDRRVELWLALNREGNPMHGGHMTRSRPSKTSNALPTDHETRRAENSTGIWGERKDQ